ncbi:hypothetical protein LWI28_004690 [Acer negundo]|uniref:Uncharacterized protein n=1 Tax=Acer negundo TaxID=4023 RepID=A0AAD5J2Y3_ACENE|nr:hypothetical protein LWI28_004690 [Acer negundo]
MGPKADGRLDEMTRRSRLTASGTENERVMAAIGSAMGDGVGRCGGGGLKVVARLEGGGGGLKVVARNPESTDHSQVSIDVSFDDDNGIPDDEKHLCPRRIHKEEHAPAQGFLEEPTEIVQVLPTSTDHSQVSIDISSDASNDDVNENLKLQHEGVAKIVKSGDLDSLQRFGGVNGISQALRTDLHKGIPGDDSVIFFLSVSAVLSIGFGIDEKGLRTGWYEGCIIALGIIVLVVLSSSIREFLNEKQNK